MDQNAGRGAGKPGHNGRVIDGRPGQWRAWRGPLVSGAEAHYIHAGAGVWVGVWVGRVGVGGGAA